jgi:hypothetical protein
MQAVTSLFGGVGLLEREAGVRGQALKQLGAGTDLRSAEGDAGIAVVLVLDRVPAGLPASCAQAIQFCPTGPYWVMWPSSRTENQADTCDAGFSNSLTALASKLTSVCMTSARGHPHGRQVRCRSQPRIARLTRPAGYPAFQKEH